MHLHASPCCPLFVTFVPFISLQVGDAFERELYILRKQVEKERNKRLPAEQAFDFYTCSLSTRTIVYKGMLRSVVVGQFFEVRAA